MSEPVAHFTKPRVQTVTNEPGVGSFSIEHPIDYVDGFHVTVGWEEEDGCWYARLTGTLGEDGPLGHGDTKEQALLCLCCSLACLSNAFYNIDGEKGVLLAQIQKVVNEWQQMGGDYEAMRSIRRLLGERAHNSTESGGNA